MCYNRGILEIEFCNVPIFQIYTNELSPWSIIYLTLRGMGVKKQFAVKQSCSASSCYFQSIPREKLIIIWFVKFHRCNFHLSPFWNSTPTLASSSQARFSLKPYLHLPILPFSVICTGPVSVFRQSKNDINLLSALFNLSKISPVHCAIWLWPTCKTSLRKF